VQADRLERMPVLALAATALLVVGHRRELQVEVAQCHRAVLLLDQAADAYRIPAGLQRLEVAIRQPFATVVQVGEAHHVELRLDIANLLDFQQPLRGHPRERANRINPDINFCRHTVPRMSLFRTLRGPRTGANRLLGLDVPYANSLPGYPFPAFA